MVLDLDPFFTMMALVTVGIFARFVTMNTFNLTIIYGT